MAKRLVEGMSAKWNPVKFHDEYRDDVLAVVARKVKSGDVHTIVEADGSEAQAAPARDVVDLMPLLKKSLEAHSRGDGRDASRSRASRERTSAHAPRRHKASSRRAAAPAKASARAARGTSTRQRKSA
jgi:DNA end-binding protein Ku